MRISTSLGAAIVFALVFGVSIQASAIPVIGFASDVRIPSECSLNSDLQTLDCTASTGTVLTFTVIIKVSTEGMQGYSFGAQWDADNQAALELVSGKQAYNGTLFVAKTPPTASASFSPVGGARSPIANITQSTASNPGLLPAWSAISAAPESSEYVGSILDGTSYRAGRLSVTVADDTNGTVIQLGFFDPNFDSFLAAGGGEVTPLFNVANINTAPEPAAVLSALAGLAAIGYLGVRSRRSR